MINGENYTLDLLETYSEAEKILYEQFTEWQTKRVDYSIYAVQFGSEVSVMNIMCAGWTDFEEIVNAYLNRGYRVYTTGGVYITKDEYVKFKGEVI